MKRILLASLGLSLLLAAPAVAVDIKTWPFDVSTMGEDVTWTSPTAVSNTDVVYTLGYTISMIELTVHYLIFDIDVDVTDQVPPDLLTGSNTVAGPPPVTVFDGVFAYPEPPETPGMSADLHIGVDANGYGTVSATNVFLGQLSVPPYGTVTVERIHVVGQLSAAAGVYAKGDLNCDVVVDFADINAFVEALLNPTAYANHYPGCDIMNGDLDDNGEVGFSDINPFVQLLLSGG